MKIKKYLSKKILLVISFIFSILTLVSCQTNALLIVNNVEIVTSTNDFESADTLRLKIDLKNPNELIIESCEISKNDESLKSYPVTMSKGKYDVCYVDISNFKYQENDCYKLHSVSYMQEETLQTFRFNAISTVNLHSTEKVENNINVSKIELSDNQLSYGQTIDINLTLNDPNDSKPRYADITFKILYEDANKTMEIEITREKLYLRGSNNYYTLTDVKVPTQTEFEEKIGLSLSDINLDEKELEWNVYCSKIQYGYSSDFINLSGNVKTSLKLLATSFEILSGTTDFNFKTAKNYDINGYLYLTKGSTIPYITVTFTNPNDYEIKGIVINDYIYSVGTGLSLSGSISYNKVEHEATILLTKATLQRVDADGLKIQGVSYINVNGEQKIASFKEEYVYSAFRSYDIVVEKVEDLYVTNQDFDIKNNIIHSNILFRNEISLEKDDLENTIFNGKYSFDGFLEGNGKLLNIEGQTLSLFKENNGTIRNLEISGRMEIKENKDLLEDNEAVTDVKISSPVVCISNSGVLKNLIISKEMKITTTESFGTIISPILTVYNEENGEIEDIEISSSYSNYGFKNGISQFNYYYSIYENKGLFKRTVMNIQIEDVSTTGNYSGNISISADSLIQTAKSENLFMHLPTYKDGEILEFIQRNIVFLTSENCKINYAFKTIVYNTYTTERNSANPKLSGQINLFGKLSLEYKDFVQSKPALSWIPLIGDDGISKDDQENFQKLLEIIYDYYDKMYAIDFKDSTFKNVGFADYTYKNLDNAFWKSQGSGITATIHLDFSISKERKTYTNANIY